MPRLHVPKTGIVLPPLPQPRPAAGRRRRSWSPTMGMGFLLSAEGDVLWQDPDWQFNALHDAGEQDLLQVFFAEQAHKTKYLTLLNQGQATVVAATDTFTLNAHGYVDGDQITLGPIVTGAAGITSGQVYYVINSAANTFKVSLTSGGAAVDVTSDGTVAVIGEKRGTMNATGVVESKTPGNDGFARQQITNVQWTNDGLQAGDYRFSSALKTFGPIANSNAVASHAALCDHATNAGSLLFLTVPLSAVTTIAPNQSFNYILRPTAS